MIHIFNINEQTNYHILDITNDKNKIVDYINQLDIKKIILITDNNIFDLYSDYINNLFFSNFKKVFIYKIKAGEHSKNLEIIEDFIKVTTQENFIDKKTAIIALGGGVVGDISGFIASIIFRGIILINIPTTLLAMVDSAIGGKNGINTTLGKNTLGTIYHPEIIFIDHDFLNTLNDRYYYSGWSEIIKYGLLFSKDFFDFVINNSHNIKAKNNIFIEEVIKKSIEYKTNVVNIDVNDNNLRQLLNLGHTLAHALETYYEYRDEYIIHGEAVAIGILFSLKISMLLGYDVESTKNKLEKFFIAINLPHEIYKYINNNNKNEIVEIMSKDKKNYYNKYNFIIFKDYNDCIIKEIEIDIIQKALSNLVAA